MNTRTPEDGDVLISQPTARVAYEIAVVPDPPHIVGVNRDRAVAEGVRFAEQLEVDAWLTEDHCHFVRIGTYRRAA
jgi:hypothetical protein